MKDEKKSKFARRYDREFKENAVALVQGGRTSSEVARDLGVSKWSLSDWIADTRRGRAWIDSKALAAESPEQRELRRLRQENDYLRRQRDILKKHWASCRPRCPQAICGDAKNEPRTLPHRIGRSLGSFPHRLPRLPAQGSGRTPPTRQRTAGEHRTVVPGQPPDLRQPAHDPGSA
ncbi:MAG: transposase [Candidatus Methylacidiphilaceae bacterium]